MNDPKLRNRQGPGFWGSLANYFKLVFRLMGDRRVNFFLKLLPVFTLIYLLVPDFLPFVLDDGLVIWIGTMLFIELCPRHIVEEHRNALNQAYQQTNQPKGEVIDAKFKDNDDS